MSKQDPAARRSAVTVQLSEGVRSFQVLPYGGGTRGGGAAEDIDMRCYLPPDVSLQARVPHASAIDVQINVLLLAHAADAHSQLR